ncbi:MAG: hypothetical protein GX977_01425 [Firmicutes bacterium]|nr:hypothetical protein [Bacillota bacterium]
MAMKMVLGILCMLLVFVTPVSGQTLDTATLQVILNIPQNLWVRVSVSELVFEEKDFDTTKDAIMLEEGILATKRAAVQVVVAGNVGHALFISSLEDAFQGPNEATLPSSQMDYRMTASSDDGQWHQLGPRSYTGEAFFQTATAGRKTFNMDFRLLATWLDAPGTYEGTIIYTVVPLES